jgi:protein-S-isoprenylcysteine O-methyltransferase Ste14
VRERAEVRAGTKGYDVPLALAMAYAPLLMGVAAGLQFRYSRLADVSWDWWAGMAVLALASTGWTLWAMLSNPFFAPVVRIQTERGHTVAASGPYRYVRHPGYLGAVLFALASPVLLGSTWAAALLAVLLPAYVLRTALEDRVLREGLPGYEAYAQNVRCRLIPAVW